MKMRDEKRHYIEIPSDSVDMKKLSLVQNPLYAIRRKEKLKNGKEIIYFVISNFKLIKPKTTWEDMWKKYEESTKIFFGYDEIARVLYKSIIINSNLTLRYHLRQHLYLNIFSSISLYLQSPKDNERIETEPFYIINIGSFWIAETGIFNYTIEDIMEVFEKEAIHFLNKQDIKAISDEISGLLRVIKWRENEVKN